MTDKKTFEELIKTMPHDVLLTAVLNMGELVAMWQKEYNNAAERLEIWTENKQLKVKIETPEKIALSNFGGYDDDK